MIKKACFLVLITVFINCSSETDEIEETLPVVSISELDNLIEKKTTFNVSISEIDKPTNTTVLINENEIISTNKKDFEVEINPFDYPNGKTTLTVKTVSSNNRETVENKEFEMLKKTL